MKKRIFIFILYCAAVCCFSFTKTSLHANSDPAMILLKDSRLSTTIQCTKNGNNWEISGGDAAGYLAFVANDLGKTDAGNFSGVTLAFAPDYTRGSLTGTASDRNGNRIPVGIAYALTSTAGDTITMFSGEEHTCTGTPCSCCDFVKKDGSIIGCGCRGDDACHVESGSKCDHTVKTIQR